MGDRELNRTHWQTRLLASLALVVITLHLSVLGPHKARAQPSDMLPVAGNAYSLTFYGDTTGQARIPKTSVSAGSSYSWYLPIVLHQSALGPLPTPTIMPRLTATPTASPTPIPSASPTATHPPTATPAPTPTSTLSPLVIGHITDAHIGGSNGWVYSQRLPGVVRLVSQRADVMVDTGDCSDDGREDTTIEYLDLVTSNVTIPWRAVIGNHDTPIHFERHIGPLDWSWDVGGYRLIGINTEDINYAALDQALTTQKPCIIFGHFYLSWCTPQDQDKLRQRFLTYDVPIYVAGHSHQDSLEIDPLSGTLLLTGQRAGMGHYRLITVQGFEVETVTFEFGW